MIGHHDDDHTPPSLLPSNPLIHAESVPEATISPSALHIRSQADASLQNSDHKRSWEESSEDADWEEGSDGTSSDEEFEAMAEEIAGFPPSSSTDKEESYFSESEKKLICDIAQECGSYHFIQEHVVRQKIPIYKLLDALGYRLPIHAASVTENKLYPLLVIALRKVIGKRPRLESVSSIDDVVRVLQEAKNILVLTGAGVSVSCGIPDFRSKNGLYSQFDKYNLDDPQLMFDIDFFRENPEVFYSFAKELYPGDLRPSASHMFIKLLEDKGKLLRNYTQNIDTLEQVAGIKRVLQCHGSFATASCLRCGCTVPGESIKGPILQQKVAFCSKCSEDPQSEAGIMKPNIVFFGEQLPDVFEKKLMADRSSVDLLIVIGSSLKVAPVSEVMMQIPHKVPQIVINLTPINHVQFDVQLLGDCERIIPDLCRRLGWELEHAKLASGKTSSEDAVEALKSKPGWCVYPDAEVPGDFWDSGNDTQEEINVESD